MRLLSLLFFVFVLNINPSYGTDHRDGPDTTRNMHADILDLFSFVPKGGNSLVLIMTAYPKAETDTGFSTDIEYRFRIKPITVVKTGGALAVKQESEEELIACRFEAEPGSSGEGPPKLACELNPDRCQGDACRAEAAANAVERGRGGMRVFAGLVHDPFFSDVVRVRLRRPRDNEQEVPTVLKPFVKIGLTNPFARSHAIGLVVEIDLAKLRVLNGHDGVVGVVGETGVANTKPFRRIDRAGRVEVTNFVLCFRPVTPEKLGKIWERLGVHRIDMKCAESDVPIKDIYNQEDAFGPSGANIDNYNRLFRKGLTVLDHIDSGEDKKLDWTHFATDGKEHPLLEILSAHDYLVVDTTKTCGTAPKNRSYLDVEMSLLRAVPGGHKTCGGRVPNDDVIDTTVTVFANGPNRLPLDWWPLPTDDKSIKRIQRRDGVEAAGRPAPTCFPWLAVADRPAFPPCPDP